ncbi:hypothetical protein Srufu_002200 [Streptomyces libani subsp. rufus]|nr:hypothetical protein Srufu_002200 [Streptomyces libani subsp. rufus]
MSKGTIGYHVRVLREAGLVQLADREFAAADRTGSWRGKQRPRRGVRLVMANNNPGADAACAVPDGIDAIWERRNQHTGTRPTVRLPPASFCAPARASARQPCTRCRCCPQLPPAHCRSGSLIVVRAAETRQRPGLWRTGATVHDIDSPTAQADSLTAFAALREGLHLATEQTTGSGRLYRPPARPRPLPLRTAGSLRLRRSSLYVLGPRLGEDEGAEAATGQILDAQAAEQWLWFHPTSSVPLEHQSTSPPTRRTPFIPLPRTSPVETNGNSPRPYTAFAAPAAQHDRIRGGRHERAPRYIS